MTWQQTYRQRCTTAEKAIESIQSGDRVVIGHAAGAPQDTLQALVDHAQRYQKVEMVHMLLLGEGAYMEPALQGHFRNNSLFAGANARTAIAENRADYTPCFFYEVPKLFKEGLLSVDVALIQVAKPDAYGNCSLGVSCDYTKAAAEHAKIVIAEVNEQMPVVGGDNFLPVDRFTHIVETSHPIHTLSPGRIGEVEKAIGRNCSALIEDGSTLQMGIGSIPDAVLLSLTDKKDLGIHTEMFSDGLLELIEKGVVNGRKKTLHPGKLVATFLMGSPRLYEFIHHNPDVELYPVDYVNDPYVIAQNDAMVSINSCVEVDLMGQVASESIGLRQFSGTGGQVDYVRGAARSKGGKSIIAIPSTASKGQVSRIVPLLLAGSAVTTSRCDVDYIVTEYGSAHLRGKTLAQRAQSLIAIAHPDFRPGLLEEYKKRFPAI